MIYFQCLFLFLSMLVTFLTFIKIINSFVQIDIQPELELDFEVLWENAGKIIFTCLLWVTFFYTLQVNTEIPQAPTFVWNDDLESIPTDNSLITLEMTEGNIIFIGPYNSNAEKN